jgi:hypothetical protein
MRLAAAWPAVRLDTMMWWLFNELTRLRTLGYRLSGGHFVTFDPN